MADTVLGKRSSDELSATHAKRPHVSQFKLRIRNASQLVAVCSQGERCKVGASMQKVSVYEDGGMVVDSSGVIVAVGPETEIEANFRGCTFEQEVDARGMVVLPGLVDAHTHPVWSGDRVGEFSMKLAGASYMDIHKQGGGIGFTVQHVHKSTADELYNLLIDRLDRMLQCGTTLAEGKSGYGLDLPNELKMLKVLHRASLHHPIDIVSNFCGAHSIPKGKSSAEAVVDLVTRQIPAVKAATVRGEVSAEFIDVFCEKGVFELKETRAILEAGKAAGFALNFHAEELNPLGSAEMGVELGATAISHLEHISPLGIQRMAEKQVIAVLLPTTAYILRIEPPPARRMIDSGVPVALGSDFNPNAHCLSMPFVMNLACVTMNMTLNEALNAATINSAASLNRHQSHGSLEAGKQADFILLAAPRWEHLVYQLVDPPIQAVYKNGTKVYHRPSALLQ